MTGINQDLFPEDLKDHFIDVFKEGLDIKDRVYRRKTYHKCFIGNELVTFLVNNNYANDKEEALELGNFLMDSGVFEHVAKDHHFKNEYLFYHLTTHKRSQGKKATHDNGTPMSWQDLPLDQHDGRSPKMAEMGANARIPVRDEQQVRFKSKDFDPVDKYDQSRLDAVHPVKWINPKPLETYHLVILGAGAGGLITAAGAAGIGAKVAIIEEHLMGGDCLNVGCVPSKALIRSARAIHDIKGMASLGISGVNNAEVDFEKVMTRMRALRAEIAPVDSCERYSQELGVDVFLGRGTFADDKTINVGDARLRFKSAIIATGATAAVPAISGLAEVDFLTNSSIFNLTKKPKTLGVIGTGTIGCELAQSFQRFGTQVTMFGRRNGVLDKEDPDAAQFLKKVLTKEGVDLRLGISYEKITRDSENLINIHVMTDKGKEVVKVEKLLVATGRMPNVENIGLESCGVEYDPVKGIIVNDQLRTNQKHILAVGDCATAYKFTHMADAMARIAIRNSLFLGREKASDLIIPWTTFTDPEIAHVGYHARDLDHKNIPYDTYESHFNEVDRALIDGEPEGWVKVHCAKGKDQILGATILNRHAGEMISELTLALKHGIGLGKIASVIHPYPTQTDAIRRLGDIYNRTRLTPTVKKLFKHFLKLKA